MSTLSLSFTKKLPVIAVMYLGAGFICMIGFKLLFKYPNIFISDNPKIIPVLFKFQFLESYGKSNKFSKYFTGFTETVKYEGNN